MGFYDSTKCLVVGASPTTSMYQHQQRQSVSGQCVIRAWCGSLGVDYKTVPGLSLWAEAPTGRLPVSWSYAIMDSSQPMLTFSPFTCSFRLLPLI